jgi:hypothetical protein
MIKIQTNEKQYGSTSDDYLEMFLAFEGPERFTRIL